MKIGFDLDKVFVGYPPLVPGQLIDWLYRSHLTNQLSYRIPNSRWEQVLRRSTHLSWLRRKIEENVSFIQYLSQNPAHKLYLISSRYRFLEEKTHRLLKKYGLVSPFTAIYLNSQNEQPHFFKERVIKQLQLDLFVDDDLELLRYLKDHCPGVQLLWYNPRRKNSPVEGIGVIQALAETKSFLKES